jgi:hypothetical protein
LTRGTINLGVILIGLLEVNVIRTGAPGMTGDIIRVVKVVVIARVIVSMVVIDRIDAVRYLYLYTLKFMHYCMFGLNISMDK